MRLKRTDVRLGIVVIAIALVSGAAFIAGETEAGSVGIGALIGFGKDLLQATAGRSG